MKIGVISDTHISSQIDGRYALDSNFINNPDHLCDILEPYFKDVDAIIHAGDITDMSVIDYLKAFSKIYVVAGNMDSTEILNRFGDKKIIELGGFRIGVMHGWGSENGLTLKIRQKFISDNVDCIVFGHSHNPYNKIEDDILMFNPGSPTDKRFTEYRTIGLLYLEDKIRGEHIRLD
jgi:uncharacterized protein